MDFQFPALFVGHSKYLYSMISNLIKTLGIRMLNVTLHAPELRPGVTENSCACNEWN
jgi:hypothetical protein